MSFQGSKCFIGWNLEVDFLMFLKLWVSKSCLSCNQLFRSPRNSVAVTLVVGVGTAIFAPRRKQSDATMLWDVRKGSERERESAVGEKD